MNNPITEDRQRGIVRTVMADSSIEEQARLLLWSEGLLEIRESELSVYRKAVESLKITKRSKVIWPIVKRLAAQLRKVGWDERSWKSRLGFSAIIVTVAVFGKAKAGIAALGTALGVPLWVVFGAGAAFAGMIVDEALRKLDTPPKTTYRIIEGKLMESERAETNKGFNRTPERSGPAKPGESSGGAG